MIFPVFSSSRIPSQIRLFFAFMASLVLAPLVGNARISIGAEPVRSTIVICAELFTGFFLGMIGRLSILSLHFAASAAGAMIGLNSEHESALDDEPSNVLSDMFVSTTTVLFFAFNMHASMLLALARTYARFPMGHAAISVGDWQIAVIALQNATLSAIQMIAPFILFCVVANFTFGMLGKLVSQIPTYFVSVPFLLCGGLILSSIVGGVGLDAFFHNFVRILNEEVFL